MSTIVITGASRGIGMAAALTLARAGHSVVAAMRNPGSAPELAAISAAEALPIAVEPMDVESDASVAEAFRRILARGAVDVLVNNAGVERLGSIEETPLAEFRLCMETNYFGAIRCIQAVVPSMRERGRGLFVNVSSVAGKVCSSPMAPYAASKFALEAVSEALAQEMRPFGVRVAVVQPGIIDTRMARNIEGIDTRPTMYPHARRMAAIFQTSLANGAGTPDMIAGKILEIVSSETPQLRHPAGPDAAPLLAWRASQNDEQWTDWHSVDDDAWRAAVKRDLGMDVS